MCIVVPLVFVCANSCIAVSGKGYKNGAGGKSAGWKDVIILAHKYSLCSPPPLSLLSSVCNGAFHISTPLQKIKFLLFFRRDIDFPFP